MSHTGLLPALAEQYFTGEFIDIPVICFFVFDFEESMWLECEGIFVDFLISVYDRYGHPYGTAFGEEVFFSSGAEDCVFEDETERPNGRFETEYFGEERQQDGVLFHCLDVEGFRGDCFITWVFEIQCDSVSDEFLVFRGRGGNNNEPESGGESIGLGIRRDGNENILQVQRSIVTYRWQKLVLSARTHTSDGSKTLAKVKLQNVRQCVV